MKTHLGYNLIGLALFIVLAQQETAAADVGKDKVLAALPKLEGLAQETIRKGDVPGLSIAIVFRDEVVYLKGFGVREMGKVDPVDEDTVFQLASCSKPVSSTVVAALVSENAVAWDTQIADIDPAFQLYDAYPTAHVTIRDLFAHRSGLPGAAGNELEELGYDRNEILHRLRYVKPASSFRSTFSYSNFGFTEGGLAAANAAGLTWEDAAEQKLYRPLNMTSTSSRYADFLKHANRATLHARYQGSWQALVKRDPDAQSPAGGVSSNARDLAQWMRLELANGKYDGKQLIEADAIAQTHLPVMERGKNPVSGGQTFYGLGWGIDYGPHGIVWEHSGAFSVGARTVVKLIPSEQLGIIVLTNAFPTGVPEGLADSFFDLVFDGEANGDKIAAWNKIFASLFGPAIEAAKAAYGKQPASPAPALPLAAYTGTYANPYIGKAEIAEQSGRLLIKLGPGGEETFPLKHFDRDLFTYFPYPEMPEMPFPVTFEIARDQKASAVTIEDLNGFGMGVLTRVAE